MAVVVAGRLRDHDRMDAETPKAEGLNLPQALLLLATNDEDGEPVVPQSVLRPAVAGAILAELDLLGAIGLQGKYVRATGTAPQTDFQHQLDLIREKSRPHTPKRWVSMLESRAEVHRIYEGMASLGIVDHVGERHLGLFRTTRYPEKDYAPETALLQKIKTALAVRRRLLGCAPNPAPSGSGAGRSADHSPDRPAPRGRAAREVLPGSRSKPGKGAGEGPLAVPRRGGRTPHDQNGGGRSRNVALQLRATGRRAGITRRRCRRIFEQDLLSAGTGDNVVSERESFRAQSVHLGCYIAHDEVDPVPSPWCGHGAVRHRSTCRALRPAQQES